MFSRLFRPAELIVLTATAVSGINALVVLDVIRLTSVHLAIINIGLACVIGLAARGLVPEAPPIARPTERRAQRSDGGSMR